MKLLPTGVPFDSRPRDVCNFLLNKLLVAVLSPLIRLR